MNEDIVYATKWTGIGWRRVNGRSASMKNIKDVSFSPGLEAYISMLDRC